MEYLKKASNSAEQHANAARKVVEEVLKDIRERGGKQIVSNPFPASSMAHPKGKINRLLEESKP